ncbi:methyltransferase domain-containing protein [Prochlorococcus sp. MIT 1223]|uniref:methyltransferase domain-containing protein n=1 Tax=Prochlorococcus sp. MIT 1223 TaxID=3096217 RepID=UPI002A75F072|nr:methyltransferase domain-containing protein [Prochlorococcus sp. MIT 1223]
MNNEWQQSILKNFSKAASVYNENASIQKDIAWELASICSNKQIAKGVWVDLGSGTGHLAESLESLNPGQSVIRVDNSKEMIAQHAPNKETQVWDLDQGLPHWLESPKLIASSFVLHWLVNPTERLKEWINAVDNDGWVVISLPVKGSFNEWHEASKNAGVSCTELDLPTEQSLLGVIENNKVKHNQILSYTQKASGLTSLFKTMINVGAQATKKTSLSIGEWRRLRKAWPLSNKNEINLTWKIQLLLIQR